MKEKIFELYKKYKSFIMYMIAGGFTTVAYFSTYAIMKEFCEVHYAVNTCTSWFVSVFISFFFNKFLVFKGRGIHSLGAEMFMFFAARFLTFLIDIGGTFALIDLLHVAEWPSKISIQILIIILNYVFSKIWVFRKTNRQKFNIREWYKID